MIFIHVIIQNFYDNSVFLFQNDAREIYLLCELQIIHDNRTFLFQSDVQSDYDTYNMIMTCSVGNFFVYGMLVYTLKYG